MEFILVFVTLQVQIFSKYIFFALNYAFMFKKQEMISPCHFIWKPFLNYKLKLMSANWNFVTIRFQLLREDWMMEVATAVGDLLFIGTLYSAYCCGRLKFSSNPLKNKVSESIFLYSLCNSYTWVTACWQHVASTLFRYLGLTKRQMDLRHKSFGVILINL